MSGIRTTISRAAGIAILAIAAVSPAHAFFEDADARRAILDLREHSDGHSKDVEQLQRSILDLQGQLDGLRRDLARQVGVNEQLQQQVQVQATRSQSMAAGLDARLKQFEPSNVQLDGKEFLASPDEVRAFEQALAKMRKGEFTAARQAFELFHQQFPGSGYTLSVLYWLGNTMYVAQDYKGAIANFKLVMADSTHAKAPEAALSMSNCLLEQKDLAGSKRVLRALIEQYPESNAAQEANERLRRLK